MINWLQLLNQLFGVTPRSLSKIRLNDVSEMFNCWKLPQQQYSRVYALFLAFQALVYRCQFLSIFSQVNEHRELTVLLFFQNSYAIFVHILQHYHDFQSVHTTIFIRRKDKTNYLSNHTWTKWYHSRNKH